MKGRGFVKLQRTRETEELLRDRNAFVLLTQIAYRARFTEGANVDDLRIQQALIGDHESVGLTRKEYRSALDRLVKKWRLISVKSTSRGTIATMLDSRVYSILDERETPEKGHQEGQQSTEVNPEKRATEGANEGPSKGHQRATNQNGQNGQQGQNAPQTVGTIEETGATVAGATERKASQGDRPDSIDDVYQFADSEGIPREQADAWWSNHSVEMFGHAKNTGFKIGGKPMHDWRLAFQSWAAADAVAKRPTQDGMGNKEWWAWIRSEGFETEIANRFIAYNNAHGWKRQNPRNGRMEPIFDIQAAFLGFRAGMSDAELRNAG